LTTTKSIHAIGINSIWHLPGAMNVTLHTQPVLTGPAGSLGRIVELELTPQDILFLLAHLATQPGYRQAWQAVATVLDKRDADRADASSPMARILAGDPLVTHGLVSKAVTTAMQDKQAGAPL
jgi:hypothetical protein